MVEEFKQQKIDRSKSSLREEEFHPQFAGTEKKFRLDLEREQEFETEVSIYVDQETGERFYKMEREMIPLQKLMALLLKGVINVSDIIKVGEDYYCHEQNFSNLESYSGDILAKMDSDLFIIAKVFGDLDHRYYKRNDPERTTKERKASTVILEHHNLNIDELRKKLNFFDNGNGTLWLNSLKNTNDSADELKDFFIYELSRISNFNSERSEILKILKEETKTLLNQYSDPEKEFPLFQAKVKKSGVLLSPEEEELLFSRLKLRLEILNKVLSDTKIQE